MEPFRAERSGLYRPKVAGAVPRQIPDELFNELFAGAGLAPGPGAGRVLGVDRGARRRNCWARPLADADPGQQLITVIRKGSRALQPLPASPDAFVWLRLYQEQMHGLVPAGRDQPLWWTLRRPFRPLAYHAARAMFVRANALLGANWSLHDLRHTAAYRMARDPADAADRRAVGARAMPSSVDHADLYLTPLAEDVIAERPGRITARRAARPGPSRRPGRAAALPGRVAGCAVRGRPVITRRAQARRGRGAVPAGGACGQPGAPGGAAGAGSRRARLRRPGRRPGSRASRCWTGCSRRRSGWASPAARPTGRPRLIGILDWLEPQPGDTWQDRWQASGAERGRPGDWRACPVRWLAGCDGPRRPPGTSRAVTTGLACR